MSNKKDAATAAAADQRYFMVPETGSVYTLTELEGLKAEGYGYDSDPSDWTEDPPADGSIAPPPPLTKPRPPRLAGLQNSQLTRKQKNGIASDPM